MYAALSIFFFTLHILFALIVFYLIVSFFTGAPFVPSQKKAVESMIALARLKPGMVVYDLGSGDGRIVREAAKRGATATGIEINPFLVLFSNISGAPTRWQNLWKADLSDADVVFVYLLPRGMERLQAKLTKELKEGSLVVTNSFIFPSWKILRANNKTHTYVFRV